MSFLSGLKAFGMDIEKGFAWFGSPKGQAVVATGEAVAIAAGAPPAIITLFNSWAAKAYNVEALAVTAGKAAGTGADKAAAVMTAVTPEVLQYVQQAGVSARTAAQIQAGNDALVAFVKAMTDPAPVAPAA